MIDLAQFNKAAPRPWRLIKKTGVIVDAEEVAVVIGIDDGFQYFPPLSVLEAIVEIVNGYKGDNP